MSTSALDFWAGRQSANLANSRSVTDASKVADEWGNFAGRLQGQLDKTTTDFARAEAGRSGVARLLKIVTAELQRVDPSNPLVREEMQNQIIAQGAADKFALLGYDYDPQKGSFKKR